MNNLAFIDKLMQASDRAHGGQPPNTLRLVLRFGETRMGHPELGFMRYLRAALRKDAINWAEYEEQRYVRWVRRFKGRRITVVDGVAYLEVK